MLLRVKSLPVFSGQVLEAVLSRLLESPNVEAVNDAVKRLTDLGALDPKKQLTPLGYHLALLPLDVRLGKLILYGAMLQVLASFSPPPLPPPPRISHGLCPEFS